jgi:hypothetical protein
MEYYFEHYLYQDYWEFLVCWSSVIKKNTTFRKLDLFTTSGEGWETPTLLGSLERANLNYWTTCISRTAAEIRLFQWEIFSCYLPLTEPDFNLYSCIYADVGCPLIVVSRTQHSKLLPPLTWERQQIPFPKLCVILYFLEYQTMDEVQKPSNPSSQRFRIIYTVY